MNFYILYSLAFLMGGSAYCGIELLYRSRTHYSMLFCSGISVMILVAIYMSNREISPLLFAIYAGAVITAMELIFGIIFNLIMDEGVWDYSHMPLNLLGQICLPFTGIWCIFGLVIYMILKIIKI